MKKVDLNSPPPKGAGMRVQLALTGTLAQRVKNLMDRYGLEQAAVVRMLIVDGLEARDGRKVA